MEPRTTPTARSLRIVIVALIALGLAACDALDQVDSAGQQQAAEQTCTCGNGEQDLAALRKFMEVVDCTHYGNSFPNLPIRWVDGPRNYYAYTSFRDHAIYFVVPNFRQDWTHNLDVIRHEMAHYAVGPDHDHGATWAREYRRLRATAVSARFNDVRAGRLDP